MICATSRNRQTQRTERYSTEEQYADIRRAQAGDIRTRDRFIEKNIRLIRKIASKYSGLAEWNDIENAGRLGCAIAIAKFDTTKGYKFSTYAIWPIKTEIRTLINELKGLSRTVIDHLRKIDGACQELELELEREPTLAEIAERTGYSQQVILNAWDKERVAETSSLNTLTGENQNCERIDLVESDDDLWDYAENISEKEYIAQLPERYNLIVRARRDGHSYRAIGRMLGLSGERIRQLFKEALAYLKHLVTYGACLVRFPQPLQAKEPEEVTKPVIKRVDATRLGGRVGRAIKKIFNPTREGFDYQLGELTNAQKPILALGRRSDHRIAPKSGHQSTSANQRCHRLGRIQDAWGGYLGFGQEILSIFLLPLAFVYLTVRGFQQSKTTITRRSTMHSIATDVFEFFGMGYRKEHPRPPNHCPDTDEDSS